MHGRILAVFIWKSIWHYFHWICFDFPIKKWAQEYVKCVAGKTRIVIRIRDAHFSFSRQETSDVNWWKFQHQLTTDTFVRFWWKHKHNRNIVERRHAMRAHCSQPIHFLFPHRGYSNISPIDSHCGTVCKMCIQPPLVHHVLHNHNWNMHDEKVILSGCVLHARLKDIQTPICEWNLFKRFIYSTCLIKK